MPYQPEIDNYDAGVYQLQTTDAALGGAGGVLNAPLLNLANRTNYLKNLIGSFFDANGFLYQEAAPTVSAAGTTQGTATQLSAQINTLTTVAASGEGVILMTPINAGTPVRVLNRGANDAILYPPVGHQIEEYGVNAGVTVPVGNSAIMIYMGSGQWYQQ